MTNRQLQNKLRNLQHVSPRAEWLSANREALLSQVHTEAVSKEESAPMADLRAAVRGVRGFFSVAADAIAAQGFASAALAFILLLGSGGFVVDASSNSLPGQPLYKVKTAVESARVQFARTPQQRVALQAELASRRLEELSILTATNGSNLPEVSALVARFETNIADVRANTAQISATTPTEAVDTARIVDERLNAYRHTLEVASVSTPKPVAKAVSKALQSVNRAGTATLKVLAEQEQEPAVAEKLAEKIDEKIKAAEDTLRLADERFIGGAKGGEKSSVSDAIERSTAVKQNLATARQKLAAGELHAAVLLFEGVEDIVYELEEVAETIVLENTTDETDAEESKVEGEVKGVVDHTALEQAELRGASTEPEQEEPGNSAEVEASTHTEEPTTSTQP